MRNKTFLLKSLVFLVLINSYGCASAKKKNERIGVIAYQELEAEKARLTNGDKKAVIAYNNLIKSADK